jgi:pimeloyl-ACP methyl ester carboxylesterase
LRIHHPAWARSVAAAGALAGAGALVRARTQRAERLHPAAGRFVEVEGARVHYVEEGDGPPLVLLHGLGSMVDDFLVSGLVARARGKYRVLAFDRPGYGHSTRPRGKRWDPLAQALLLREALRALDVHRPIVLGHSWGTQVAIALALAEPGLPRSLVLASGLYYPSVRLDAPFLVPPAIPIAGALMRHTLSPLAGRALWPLWLRMLFSPAPVPAAFSSLAWKALRPETLRAVAEEALQVLPTTLAMLPRYRALTLPVVLVAGARDKYVGARAHTGRLRRELVNGDLLVAREGGHMVHHANPALVLHAVDRAAWG